MLRTITALALVLMFTGCSRFASRANGSDRVDCDCAALAAMPRLLEFRMADDVATPGSLPLSIRGTATVVHVEQSVSIDIRSIRSASVAVGPGGQPMLQITLNDKAGATLEGWTRAGKGRRLAVIANGDVIQAGTIVGEIGGSFMISGGMTQVEMCAIACAIDPNA